MAKPRILIMDDDFSYISSLQAKFISELSDDIDLEVITEPRYFNQLFSNTQKLDVLIIDKKYYSEDINNHIIEHIFVLSEEENDTDINDNKTIVLYKYNSIKVIFREIIGKSGIRTSVNNMQYNREPEIVLIISATGGAGKTTLAMGLSAALTDMHNKVLYIEAAHLQTAQFYMKDSSPISNPQIYTKLANPTRNIYQDIKPVLRSQHYTYMPPLNAPLMAYGIDYSMYGKVAKSAKIHGEFDYIIVDADSTFDSAKAKMMDVADRVIILLEQTEASAYATDVLVRNINNVDKDKYLFVCNKYSKDNSGCCPVYCKYNFNIDDYIPYFEKNDENNNDKMGNYSGEEAIRKIAFLLL